MLPAKFKNYVSFAILYRFIMLFNMFSSRVCNNKIGLTLACLEVIFLKVRSSLLVK